MENHGDVFEEGLEEPTPEGEEGEEKDEQLDEEELPEEISKEDTVWRDEEEDDLGIKKSYYNDDAEQ
ncbi:MAG: hypothetical protein AAB581_04400 [Patescibacteria group bacterium]